MSVFNFLLNELSFHIRKHFISADFNRLPKGIMILTQNAQYLPDCIYIGSQDAVCEEISRGSVPKHTTFFITRSDNQVPPPHSALFNGYNLVFTDLSLICLNNSLNAALVKFQQLEDTQTHLPFSNFLYEVLLSHKTSREDIQEMAESLAHKIKQFFNIIIIDFKDKTILSGDTSSLFGELDAVFPGCNTAIFSRKIIVIYSCDDRYIWIPKDTTSQLERFLEDHRAISVISSPIRDHAMIRTEYYIMSNILKIVRRLKRTKKSRIFTEEQYGTYFIIDLCIKKFETALSHNDIIYLAHPGLIALLRYDSRHNTNLSDVLYCYLRNDRNLSKTAKDMYMHRNTVLNKINKISEIIMDDLDDYAVRFRLTFSFMIVQYYEQYKNSILRL